MQQYHHLIARQIPHLRRYACALTGNSTDGDDLVQEALTRALDRLHLWQPGSNMRAWIFSILHNIFVNDMTRANRRPDVVTLDDSHEDLHRVTAQQDARHQLRDMQRALRLLPDEQRQVVLLVGMEGARYKEVAEILDIPIGTVMSRLNRGRTALRELMLENTDDFLRQIT